MFLMFPVRYRGFLWTIQTLLLYLLCSVYAALAHGPHDVIDAVAVSPNFAQDKTAFVVTRQRLKKSVNGGLKWKQIQNGIDHQYALNSLEISPSFALDGNIFLTSNGDGIYRSQNHGDAWEKVNQGLQHLNIIALKLSPRYETDQTVLAASAEGVLYKSDNGGGNWRQVAQEQDGVTAIGFTPDGNTPHMWIGTGKGGLYRSADSGASWTEQAKLPDSGPITVITVSPSTVEDGVVFCGTKEHGLFRVSTTQGAASEPRQTLSGQHLMSIVISPGYATDSTLYASTWHEGVFRSTDRGATWQTYGQGLTKDDQADTPRFYAPHFDDLKISGTFSQDGTLFIGGYNGLFRSTNGGQEWVELATLSTHRIEGMAVSPALAEDATLAVTTYRYGAFLSVDGGKTWQDRNTGIRLRRLAEIAFAPNYAEDGHVFTMSNQNFYLSADKGHTWSEIHIRGRDWVSVVGALQKKLHNQGLHPSWVPLLESDHWPVFPRILAVSPNFTADGTIFLSSLTQRIFRSVDRGQTWSPVWHGKDRGFVDMAISPNFASDNTIYAGNSTTGMVHKSVDRGDTWETVYQPKAPSLSQRVRLAISPVYQDDRTLFAGTPDGLMKTTDGGDQWTPVASASLQAEDTILTLAISPAYQQDKTMLVSVKGKGLFKYVEGQLELAEIGSNLIDNNYILYFMSFSPNYPEDKTLYGASVEEVFRSADGGNTWQLLTDFSDRMPSQRAQSQ